MKFNWTRREIPVQSERVFYIAFDSKIGGYPKKRASNGIYGNKLKWNNDMHCPENYILHLFFSFLKDTRILSIT